MYEHNDFAYRTGKPRAGQIVVSQSTLGDKKQIGRYIVYESERIGTDFKKRYDIFYDI